MKFLDGADISGNSVAIQSFPRSGNTWLRKIMENITGVFSGSDMSFDVTIECMGSGFIGEEIDPKDNLCWFTKTHWPTESPGNLSKFPANKSISIARNPLEVIASAARMSATSS